MDVVLHFADEYLLDAVWARLLPASPRSAVLSRSPALLKSFVSDAQTQAALAARPDVANGTALLSLGGQPPAQVLDSALDWSRLAGLSALPRSSIIRQFVSLYTLTYIGIVLLYFSMAGASFRWIYNKDMMRHPRFLANQVRREINSSLAAFPVLDLLTVPWFVGEVNGYSTMYAAVADGPWADKPWGLGGWTYIFFSVLWFLVFTDFCIYWVHRIEHHPLLYKRVHKPHHKWIVPTPFASHAFHPLDGYAQSLPYHIFVYLFPLHKLLYIGLFGFVNMWSILIHDSDMITNTPFEKVINGPAHHTLHHIYFTVNYGQYFTAFDRLGSSYRQPMEKDDPLLQVAKAKFRPTTIADSVPDAVVEKQSKKE